MPYVWDFAILGKYSHLFWIGLGWTIAYTIGTVLLGTLIGLTVGILRLPRWPVIDWLLVACVEIFRGGIESIERGQWDAAKSLGLGPWPMLRLVILPQAFKRMLAPYVNQSI